MDLEIISIDNKGILEKECVWLRAKADCKLGYHMISDTTYNDNDTISNEVRHTHWFKSADLKKGAWVQLMTKDGTDTTSKDKDGNIIHIRFWKIGRTIWNKKEDCAVLFELKTWKTTRS